MVYTKDTYLRAGRQPQIALRDERPGAPNVRSPQLAVLPLQRLDSLPVLARGTLTSTQELGSAGKAESGLGIRVGVQRPLRIDRLGVRDREPKRTPERQSEHSSRRNGDGPDDRNTIAADELEG